MKHISILKTALFTFTIVAATSFTPRAEAQTNISAIYSGGSGAYTGLSGTVTGILSTATNTDTFVVQDSTGSVLLYNITKTNYTPTVGDTVNFNATDSTYQGAPELVNTGFTLTSSTSGTAPAPTTLTVPQFNAAGTGSTANGGTGAAVAPNGESIVTLTDITLPAGTTTLTTNTNYTLTDATSNTTTLYGYKSDSAVLAAINAANAMESSNSSFYSGALNITGYVDVFNGVPEIYPLSFSAYSAAVPEPKTYLAGGLFTMITGLSFRQVRRRMVA